MNQIVPNNNEEITQQYKDQIKMNYFETMVERAKLKFKSKKEKSPPMPASSDAVIIVNVCFAYFSKLFKLMKKTK